MLTSHLHLAVRCRISGVIPPLFFHSSTALVGLDLICWRFEVTLRHTTLGRTPLDEWSALRQDLYLTTHITHTRQTAMTLAGFEPAILAGERPKAQALERATTSIAGALHVLIRLHGRGRAKFTCYYSDPSSKWNGPIRASNNGCVSV
jgi:hypothetical protein